MTPLARAAALSVVLAAAATAQNVSPPAPQAPPTPCHTAPRAHEFDFWIGTWDLTWPHDEHGHCRRATPA